MLREEGFTRLPRRGRDEKKEFLSSVKLEAAKSEKLENKRDFFNTEDSIGVMSMLPYICDYGIDKLIEKSKYPGTKTIPKTNSILSFLALKISNFQRYGSDDLWCMDRCLGLFAFVKRLT